MAGALRGAWVGGSPFRPAKESDDEGRYADVMEESSQARSLERGCGVSETRQSGSSEAPNKRSRASGSLQESKRPAFSKERESLEQRDAKLSRQQAQQDVATNAADLLAASKNVGDVTTGVDMDAEFAGGESDVDAVRVADIEVEREERERRTAEERREEQEEAESQEKKRENGGLGVEVEDGEFCTAMHMDADIKVDLEELERSQDEWRGEQEEAENQERKRENEQHVQQQLQRQQQAQWSPRRQQQHQHQQQMQQPQQGYSSEYGGGDSPERQARVLRGQRSASPGRRAEGSLKSPFLEAGEDQLGRDRDVPVPHMQAFDAQCSEGDFAHVQSPSGSSMRFMPLLGAQSMHRMSAGLVSQGSPDGRAWYPQPLQDQQWQQLFLHADGQRMWLEQELRESQRVGHERDQMYMSTMHEMQGRIMSLDSNGVERFRMLQQNLDDSFQSSRQFAEQSEHREAQRGADHKGLVERLVLLEGMLMRSQLEIGELRANQCSLREELRALRMQASGDANADVGTGREVPPPHSRVPPPPLAPQLYEHEDRRMRREDAERELRDASTKNRESEGMKKKRERENVERERKSREREEKREKQKGEKAEMERRRRRAQEDMKELESKTVFLNRSVIGKETLQMVMILLLNTGLLSAKVDAGEAKRGMQELAEKFIESVSEPELGYAKVVFKSSTVAKSVRHRFQEGRRQRASALELLRLWSEAEWRGMKKKEQPRGSVRGGGQGNNFQVVCPDWKSKGVCSRSACSYTHEPRDRPKGVCFGMRDNGFCRFGGRCKFVHPNLRL